MAERALRLVGIDGELPEDAPRTMAEALVEIDNLRAQKGRLEEENGHLSEALKRSQIQLQRMKAQQHKDLRVHKDYAACERLWEKYRTFHPRSPEEIPDDYLRMGLDLLKSFDEAYLARALDGAKANPPVDQKTGHVYDLWANVFRNAGNMENYVRRADQAEGRAHRDRDPAVEAVLRELHLSALGDLAARCRCGHLMVQHGFPRDGGGAQPCAVCGCEDGDDQDWRAEQWIAAQYRKAGL